MEDEIEQMYMEHYDHVYRYIYLMIRHKENTEDLTQETFYKAAKSLKSFQYQASVSTWLLKIASNVTYDYFRRKKNIQYVSLENDLEVSHDLSLEDMMEQKEQFSQLHQALKGLKKDYWEVLICRKINGCSIKETAYILGWTEAKVKTKTARALEALKKELIGKFEI